MDGAGPGASRKPKAQDLLALAAFLALTALVFARHAPWLDEIQGYVIASASDLPDLFARLRYEGHPPLWHLLAFGVLKLSPGFEALKLLHFLFTAGVLAAIWLRSPFPFWARLLVSAHAAVLFVTGTLVRSYGLGEALYFLWLCLWRWRPARAFAPAILLLEPFTAMPFSLLAGASALYAISLKRLSPAFLPLQIAVMGFCALFFRPPADFIAPLPPDSLAGAMVHSGAILFPLSEPAVLEAAAAATGPILILLCFRKTPVAALLSMMMLASLIAFAALFYPMAPYHYAAVWIGVIGFAWMGAEEGRFSPAEPGFAALLSLGAALGAIEMGFALVVPASHSLALSRAVRELGLQSAPMAAYPGERAVELAFAAGRPQFDPQRGCRETRVVWNHRAPPVLGRDFEAYVRRAAQETSGRVLLYTEPKYVVRAAALAPRPLTHFGKDLRGEDFELFEIDLPPGARAAPPLCPEEARRAGMRSLH